MNDMRPRVRVISDVGYRVLMRDSDGAPRQVLRGFVKEGDYGKFLSIETHWVQRMDGDRIVESRWARKTINFPYDRERAMTILNSIRELVEACFASEHADEDSDFLDEMSHADEDSDFLDEMSASDDDVLSDEQRRRWSPVERQKERH